MPAWVCTPLKHGFTPRFEYAHARSSPFGPVRLENLAVRSWAWVFVPFGAHFGLFAKETWMYAPGCVCTFSLEPMLACTPRKPGCVPWACVYVPVRARFGLYAQETRLYAPGRVCTCPFVPVRAYTPGKPGFTPLDECARARSCPFGPARPGNLAVRR